MVSNLLMVNLIFHLLLRFLSFIWSLNSLSLSMTFPHLNPFFSYRCYFFHLPVCFYLFNGPDFGLCCFSAHICSVLFLLAFIQPLSRFVPRLVFCSQALLVRALLEYSQSLEAYVPYGLSLVAGIFLMELIRSWSLALMWAVNYRTAARLRGAALTFAFHKILRLRSTKDIGPGEVGGTTPEGAHLQIN